MIAIIVDMMYSTLVQPDNQMVHQVITTNNISQTIQTAHQKSGASNGALTFSHNDGNSYSQVDTKDTIDDNAALVCKPLYTFAHSNRYKRMRKIVRGIIGRILKETAHGHTTCR